jgi:hypothetical protein
MPLHLSALAWLWPPLPLLSHARDRVQSPQTTTSGRHDSQKHLSAHKTSFTSGVHSLEHARPEVQYPEKLEGNVLGRALLTVMGGYTRRQKLKFGATVMYAAVKEQAESRQLQEGGSPYEDAAAGRRLASRR